MCCRRASNLQDATRLVNYDLHWNPVRLMQRIGRVDRRMSPETEERLRADHPEAVADRGTVRFWNFPPPEELEADPEVVRAGHRQGADDLEQPLGIEGRKLLRPDDAYDPLREFNATYEGTRTAVEEMHLEYQALLKRHPELAGRLDGLPGSVSLGPPQAQQRVPEACSSATRCPRSTQTKACSPWRAGPTRWYLYDLDADAIVESSGEIIESIRSKPNTPRRCDMGRSTLKELRDMVLRHVRDTYLKRVNAPIGAPEPRLRCWMELN